MILHIATVGIYANERIDYVVLRRGVEKLILIYTKVNDDEILEIEKRFEDYGIPVDLVLVKPYDYNLILSLILEEIVKHPKYEIEFNVSCGTRVMVAAMYMAAVLVDSPVYFVCPDEEEDLGDLVTVQPLTQSILTKPKRNILNRLIELGGSIDSQTELGSRVSLGAASISKHVKELEKFRYVKRIQEKGKYKVEITDLGRVILKLKYMRKDRIWGKE